MVRCYTRLSLYVVSALLCWPLLVHAQGNFPTRPIRIISPFAPGGSTSTIARVIGQKLTESWGQQIIVDNRPGGNTIIGADTLAKASPDGYSYILTTNTHIINKVSTEVTRIMALPDVLNYLAMQGMNAYTSMPEQLDARMKGDMARWAKVIKAANIKIDI